MTNSVVPFAVGLDLDGDGAHPAAWRAARHAPNELLSPARIAHLAEQAEAAGFTYVSFADSAATSGDPALISGRLSPIETAAFAAARTRRIGLVPVADTIHAEPYHLSNQLSSLDYASKGRAGWFAGAADSPQRARAFGAPQAIDPHARRREASEVVDAARRLWDTWEDGVLIADTATGRFLDADKMHYADVQGEFVQVKGPALLPRPIQGQLVVFAYPESVDPGLADVLVVSAVTEDALIAAARRARSLGSARVVADIEVVLDTTSARARDRIATLDLYTAWAATERLRFDGSAAELVALINRLAEHVDGVRLRPAVIDIDVPELAALVLPALESAGTFTSPTPGHTLRDLFGLTRPASRYATT